MSKNTIVYLKNGQKANLISDLGDHKYLVDPYEYYEGYYNGDPDYEPRYYEDLSGNLRIVNEFFKKPPTPVIEESILKLQSEYDELKKSKNGLLVEINAIKNELERFKKENNDIQKWKVDLSKFKNAKRIIYFVKEKISPCIIEDNEKPKYSSKTWELTFKVDCHNGEYKTFSYGYYQNNGDYNSDKIDEEYGFLFDLSDDEIIKIAQERCLKMNFENHSSYNFRDENEIYFAQNAFDRLLEIKKNEKENTIKNLKKSIEDDQETLLSLIENKEIDASYISFPPKKSK